MFKKFIFSLVIFSIIICYIYSFSKATDIEENIMYYPVKNTTNISSYYGYRDLFGKSNFHNGIDFPVSENTPIYSTLGGTIIFATFNKSGYGNCIIISHGNGYKSLYGHLSENFIVTTGQSVKSNQLIGFVGPKILSDGRQNGITTGVHLHFTIFDCNGKTVDPLSFEYKKE